MKHPRRVIARFLAALVALFGGAGGGMALAQQEPAVLSAVTYLGAHYGNQPAGESAMIALALLKAEVPPNNPAVTGTIARFMRCFTGNGYEPERKNGTGVYEAAAGAMALANLDAAGNSRYLNMIATYL